MRKYTRPELVCKVFESENILTASGTQTYESSMTKLTKDLTDNYHISSDYIVSDLW
ncbi:MAG: hypothetical protein IJH37_11470 [Clostridia bacterium]|nr:hypothetical protein [Clostridia bacterium]